MSEKVLEFEEKNYKVSICKDGMIMLAKKINDKSEYEEKWKDYLKILNSIQFLFESSFLETQNIGYLELSEITNKDAFGITLENNQFKSQGVPTGSYAEKETLHKSVSS